MADTVRLWIETSHHAAFRVGGWAFVLHDGKGLSGAAGGERGASPERTALLGLARGLADAPATGAIAVASADPLVVGVPRRIAGFAKEPPALDVELWAQIGTVLKARKVSFAVTRSEPKTPTAFSAAWAELGRDKAKSTGDFKSPIPRTNLAKAGV